MSKLIAWGVDRPAAINRMRRALAEYRVVGVRTTIPILRQIIAHEDFRAARLSTNVLERLLPGLRAAEGRHRSIAVLAAALAEYERLGHATLPPATLLDGAVSAWRRGGRAGWSHA